MLSMSQQQCQMVNTALTSFTWLSLSPPPHPLDDQSLSTGIGKRSHKVLFRRGKAKIIRGDFKGGRKDFLQCREICGNPSMQGGETEMKEIERELKKLDVLVKKGKKDEGIRKKAMQRVMGGGEVRVYEGGDGRAAEGTNGHGTKKDGEKTSEYDSKKEEAKIEEKVKQWLVWPLVVLVLAILMCLK